MGNRGKKYLMETTTQQLEDAVGSKVKINTKETFRQRVKRWKKFSCPETL